jgi:hypothetical protein
MPAVSPQQFRDPVISRIGQTEWRA